MMKTETNNNFDELAGKYDIDGYTLPLIYIA